jgi:hypothetical protein
MFHPNLMIPTVLSICPSQFRFTVFSVLYSTRVLQFYPLYPFYDTPVASGSESNKAKPPDLGPGRTWPGLGLGASFPGLLN